MEKPCETCGNTIVKPRTCGLPEWTGRRFCSPKCKAESQKGKATWNAGRRAESRAKKLPCRICGNPTRYNGTKGRLALIVRCDAPECIKQSRAIKNANLSANLKGRRCGQGTWKSVALISPEELLLTKWFAEIGFTPQVKVRTNIIVNKHGALTYRLDFASQPKKLYVEIDGSVHDRADRKSRDTRRDAILASLGWTGLRIPAEQVTRNPEQTKTEILHWLNSYA